MRDYSTPLVSLTFHISVTLQRTYLCLRWGGLIDKAASRADVVTIWEIKLDCRKILHIPVIVSLFQSLTLLIGFDLEKFNDQLKRRLSFVAKTTEKWSIKLEKSPIFAQKHQSQCQASC